MERILLQTKAEMSQLRDGKVLSVPEPSGLVRIRSVKNGKPLEMSRFPTKEEVCKAIEYERAQNKNISNDYLNLIIAEQLIELHQRASIPTPKQNNIKGKIK